MTAACTSDVCESGKLMCVDEALAHLLEQATPINAVETVETAQALGRILAEDQISSIDVPPLDNSGMDGYAVAVADLSAEGETWLSVKQRICAGDPQQKFTARSAARIFTGAPIPEGADAVIPQERCEVKGDSVQIPANIYRGANIRRRGEDITNGNVVLRQGARIRAQEIGMAATMGFARLPVYQPLRVAIFSTGDELVSLGEPLHSGQIYDSNRYSIIGLLQGLGCEITDLGRVADNFQATQQVLSEAAEAADLIVTSGGVSVGEEDYVKAAVESLGNIDLWRIAIKPGKPLAYGQVHQVPFFGLPGNPVATFITFCIFVRPYILKMQGAGEIAPQTVSLPALFEWPKSGKRREFARARIELAKDGKAGVTLYPHQGSGVLSSVVWANGLAILPEGKTIQHGDAVDFIPFSELLS